MSNLEIRRLGEVEQSVATRGTVCLHFHPDRTDNQGLSVLDSILEHGLYRSQFETGLSAGSVSAWPGGYRYDWETDLFGGAYDMAAAEERPKYGALNLFRPPDGPAPRFGSCYLELKPEVTARCTFTYLDSYTQPSQRGTLEVFDDILAALFTECFERNYALGLSIIKVADLCEHILQPSSSLPLH